MYNEIFHLLQPKIWLRNSVNKCITVGVTSCKYVPSLTIGVKINAKLNSKINKQKTWDYFLLRMNDAQWRVTRIKDLGRLRR